NVVFTARDADVIKTYVRIGMGVGVVASMASECDDTDLTAIDATGLFPRLTTWVGFPRDKVLRRYMVEFIELLAGHLTPELVAEAATAGSQEEVDALFGHLQLPLRGVCADDDNATKKT
ncbi:MAG: hypothetical protein HKN49_01710, partial [Gammaproteobacteria bacterium]|nr:hypothetical protein [Gammaproteobacteria bacterium]